MERMAQGIVRRNGTQFEIDGRPFFFAGCNCYHILYSDRDTTLRLLDEMCGIGATVVRIWAFGHGAGSPVEEPKGVYGEAYLEHLDFILDEASKRGLRMILVLENFWPDYGGISARLAWEGLPDRSLAERAAFFTHVACLEGYEAYARNLLTRVNGISGVSYREDPTLFAWELMNEPRYQDVSEEENLSGATLRAWVDRMGAFVKGFDSIHLLGAGLEGHGSVYGFGGDEGNDFLHIHQSPFLDFCTSHPYPDAEWCGMDPDGARELVRQHVRDAHRRIGKPYVLEEFNTTRFLDYEAYWQAMYDAVEEENASGDLFWCYHQDGGGGFNLCKHDPVVKTVFRRHAQFMNGKSGNIGANERRNE
jgi:mannan endo-1,4-beta-mannosidase